ncbi:hypothetical protein CAPTEDRAFT_201704 [Capitella teleta]|uniref:Uncharacterized protein n=1 Tax=Capitella teleta TaxID=283909 RepID=R7U812_CAPTE|nr:hypothetical protein CAPTEDRAFT_201704 [Capitella teleta]|eukprot:ELU02500.1 hypothetical protein CAPTEDRAFT_201704 [Capitella teleta]
MHYSKTFRLYDHLQSGKSLRMSGCFIPKHSDFMTICSLAEAYEFWQEPTNVRMLYSKTFRLYDHLQSGKSLRMSGCFIPKHSDFMTICSLAKAYEFRQKPTNARRLYSKTFRLYDHLQSGKSLQMPGCVSPKHSDFMTICSLAKAYEFWQKHTNVRMLYSKTFRLYDLLQSGKSLQMSGCFIPKHSDFMTICSLAKAYECQDALLKNIKTF